MKQHGIRFLLRVAHLSAIVSWRVLRDRSWREAVLATSDKERWNAITALHYQRIRREETERKRG